MGTESRKSVGKVGRLTIDDVGILLEGLLEGSCRQSEVGCFELRKPRLERVTLNAGETSV